MLLRLLPLLMTVLILPPFATAATYWQISATTSPTTLGSSLNAVAPASPGDYTTTGTLTKITSPTITGINYVVTVPSGYALTNVKVDGAVKGTTAGTYTVNKGTTSSHTIVASYTTANYAITTVPATNGSISPSKIYSSSASITVTPFTDFQLTGVVIDNTTYPLAATLPAFVTRSGGSSGATYTFTTGYHTIQGLFAALPLATAVIATANQAIATGTTGIAMDGSASTSNVPGTTYDWTATCGTVTPTTPNAKTATYDAPATTGSCTVMLTVTAAGVTPNPAASVTFTIGSPDMQSTNSCLSCHNGTGGPAVPGFTTTTHYTAINCAGCHNPDNNLSHPYSPLAGMANICINCHTSSPQGHPVAIGAYICVSCHAPHSTVISMAGMQGAHYNNITSGMYPASYVTSRASCKDCHSAADNNAPIRSDWAASGHGNTGALPWIASDFKTGNGCVRCHTTTGYVNYINSDFTNTTAWGDPADKAKEVLACNGCHNPDFSRRTFSLAGPSGPTFTFSFPVSGTDVTASYKFSSLYNPPAITNTDSNICLPCHSGTLNGEIIKQATAFADFTSAGRLRSHGMAAAGTLGDLTGGGYNFDEAYHVAFGTNDRGRHWSYHEFIGSTNFVGEGNNGACVTCHMSGTQHTFAAVFKNATGSITGVTTQAMCDKCHGSSGFFRNYPVSAAVLTARKAGFADALLLLKAQLQKSGFDPDSAAPKNWGGTAHIRANNMGAYYNYFFLRDGDRAAYVHGPAYTRRLIVNSLNWLDDSTFNTSAFATINTLASEGRITAATRDSAISFLNITSVPGIVSGMCASCHVGGVDGNIY